MSYVSINDPLPQNSTDPPSASQTACYASIVQDIETQVANAKAASAQIATPVSFSSLGQGVVNDVSRGQNELIAAQALKNQPSKSRYRVGDSLSHAPVQVPLNIPAEQFNGCSVRGITALLPVKSPRPKVSDNMPPPAPTDTQLLGGGITFPVAGAASPFVRGLRGGSVLRKFRGMGVVWGDSSGGAIIAPPTTNWNAKGLLLLALGGLGLYAVTRKGR